MESIATRSDPVHVVASVKRFAFVERMFAFANRYRASGGVPRLLETWADARCVDEGYRWVKRRHPRYELQFEKHTRGQSLLVCVDYCAGNDFLGLFIYWPTKFEPGAFEHLYKTMNTVNLTNSYGNFELVPSSGRLRFRNSVDAEGVRLTPAFLDYMLDSGLGAIDRHATDFLPGPIGLVGS